MNLEGKATPYKAFNGNLKILREVIIMDEVWNRENFESSITRTCFSSTPYDAGWDGDARWNINGKVLQRDPEMRRLLELELDIRPVPVWVQKVARQIQEFPPCGWCFPQYVEAVCKNIGAGDAAAVAPCGCYTVGAHRLQLMANYAVCLDGWLKKVSPETVAAELLQNAFDERDWPLIARKMWDVLGELIPPKVLLVRRLLARLRFWLRAPFGLLKADDNWRLGYLYTHAMGRYGGWDYFSFEDHDPDVIELDERIRAEISNANRWLELINSTWPCAPKVFRFLERIIIAIGEMEKGCDTSPDELAAKRRRESILQIEGTYLGSDRSHSFFDTSVRALGKFVLGAFPVAVPDETNLDTRFGSHLEDLLGDSSAQKVWLAALLLKRITLFKDSFKSYHFTRNAQQVL